MNSRSDALALAGLLVGCGALLAPAVLPLAAVPAIGIDPDGVTQLSFAHVLWDAVVQHGEYPLWNPYFGGGVPWAGYLYNPGLTPVSLPILLFGEVIGTKVWMFCVLGVGAAGLYACARRWLALPISASLVGASLYGSAAWLPARSNGGNFDELALYLLPAFVYALHGLFCGRRSGFWVPVLYLTAFAQAKYAAFVFAAAALVFALAFGWERRAFARALGLWALSLAFGVLFALPKLLPLLALLDLDRVDQTSYGAGIQYAGWRHLLHTTLYPDGHFNHMLGFGTAGFWLALCGVVRGERQQLAWTGLLLSCGLLVLGQNSPVPLWRLLHALPVLGTMNSFAKYWNIGVLVALAGLAALGYRALCEVAGQVARRCGERWPAMQWLQGPRVAGMAHAVALGAILWAPALDSRALYGQIFDAELRDLPASKSFYQVAYVPALGQVSRYRAVAAGDRESNQYYNVRRDVGTLTWYGNLVLEENPTASRLVGEDLRVRHNPDYRGELTCPESRCRFGPLQLSYNTLAFEVEFVEPATVVVNQNYHPGWQSRDGEIAEHEGRLALELRGTGTRQVALRFHDGRFALGCWLAVGALVAWGFILRRLRASR